MPNDNGTKTYSQTLLAGLITGAIIAAILAAAAMSVSG